MAEEKVRVAATMAGFRNTSMPLAAPAATNTRWEVAEAEEPEVMARDVTENREGIEVLSLACSLPDLVN